jgi:hypothetical protein
MRHDPGASPLLDDDLDRLACGCEIGDRDQFRPLEKCRQPLARWWPDARSLRTHKQQSPRSVDQDPQKTQPGRIRNWLICARHHTQPKPRAGGNIRRSCRMPDPNQMTLSHRDGGWRTSIRRHARRPGSTGSQPLAWHHRHRRGNAAYLAGAREPWCASPALARSCCSSPLALHPELRFQCGLRENCSSARHGTVVPMTRSSLSANPKISQLPGARQLPAERQRSRVGGEAGACCGFEGDFVAESFELADVVALTSWRRVSPLGQRGAAVLGYRMP